MSDDARPGDVRPRDVRLRAVEPDDLTVFYEHQRDPEATRMAAFASRDRAAFDVHWATNILGNPAAIQRTILADGQVAGHVGSWPQDGVRLVGYWIGKEFWGKGVATRALGAFLQLVTERPLRAHVAQHNLGSIRVLEQCGFTVERDETIEVGGEEVAESVFVLRGARECGREPPAPAQEGRPAPADREPRGGTR